MFVRSIARWLRHLLFYGVIPIGLLAASVWIVIGPQLAETAAKRWLAANKVSGISFDVSFVGASSMLLENIALGDGAVTARQASLHYKALPILREGLESKLLFDRLVLVGVRWHGRIVDGAPVPDPRTLVQIERPAGTTSHGFVPPVRAVELRDALIVLGTDQGEVSMPINATAALSDVGAVSGHADVSLTTPFGAARVAVEFDGSIIAQSFDLFAEISDAWLRADWFTGHGISGQVAFQVNERALYQGEGLLRTAGIDLPFGPLPATISFAFADDTINVAVNAESTDQAFEAVVAGDFANISSDAPQFELRGHMRVPSSLAAEAYLPTALQLSQIGPRLDFSVAGTMLGTKRARDAVVAGDWFRAADTQLRVAVTIPGVTVPGVIDNAGIDATAMVETTNGALAILDAKIDARAASVAPEIVGMPRASPLGRLLLNGVESSIESDPEIPSVVSVDPSGHTRAHLSGSGMLVIGGDNGVAVDLFARGMEVVGRIKGGQVTLRAIKKADLTAVAAVPLTDGVSLRDGHVTLSAADGVYVGNLRFTTRGTPALPEAVSMTGSTMTVNADFTYDGANLHTQLRGTQLLRLDGLRVGTAPTLDFTPVTLAFDQRETAPLVEISGLDSGPVRWRAQLQLQPSTVDIDRTDGNATLQATVTTPPLKLTAAGVLRHDGHKFSAELAGDGGRVAIDAKKRDETASSDGSIGLIAESLAVAFNADHTGQTKLSLEMPSLRHAVPRPAITPLQGNVEIATSGSTITLLANITEPGGNLVIAFDGRHDTARDQGSGNLQLYPIIFLEDGLQPTRLLPLLANRLGPTQGQFRMAGPITWSDGRLASALDLTVSDFSTSWDGIEMLGVNSVITFDALLPPSTPPGQLVAIRGIDLGLPLTDGLLSVRLDRDGQPLLENAVFQWAGGSVRVASSHLPDTGALLLNLDIDGIELDQLLELTPERANLEATGRLNGRIPVVMRDGAFVITEGWLESTFDGGTLTYRPENLESALLAGGPGVKLLLDALDDFAYSRLRVDLTGRGDGQTDLRFRIRGANPAVYGGSEFELNLSITGKLEQILRETYEAYYEIPEEVARQLAPAGDAP